MQTKTILMTAVVLASFVCQTISLHAQRATDILVEPQVDAAQILGGMRSQAAPASLATLLEKLFGSDATEAAAALSDGREELLLSVKNAASQRTEEVLDDEITKRRESKSSSPAIAPETKSTPAKRTPGRRRIGFVGFPSRFDWRQVALGFQPFSPQDERPDVKMTETDKEIKAEGTDKKEFENKDAKGTRVQKAETRYIKDGKTFGMYIKQVQVIEAVSKPEGKVFRQELAIEWGAEVAACPDVEGVTSGTGMTKVTSKTTYSENGETVSMSNDFDIQVKMKGFVNDQAQLKYYDFAGDGYVTSFGGENALRRGMVRELKIKDGRHGVHFDIPGNTIEVSDGTYGGPRTPAKMGKIGANFLTTMSPADQKTTGEAIGKMIPAIWNSANEMYMSAQRNWQTYGCVEVQCKARKSTLAPGEDVAVTTETVHLHDGSKVNAELKGSAYQGSVTPEEELGRPGATFTLTASNDGDATFFVESTSKRGIGKGSIEFHLKKEKESAPAKWAGTIKAERKTHDDREKRSGANLAEFGGYTETTTNVQLEIDGRIDPTVESTTAYVARITGVQQTIDYEYDRYKVDEGFCGPNAVQYKGPKEIVRTNTMTANYARDTRAYISISGDSGTISFELPSISATTTYKNVHKSPCAEHDRVNTSETTDDTGSTFADNYSFSFPITPGERTIKGTITVRGDDGSTTTYSWNLTRLEKMD